MGIQKNKENRFKALGGLFCDDGGVGDEKRKKTQPTPFEGALKIDLTHGRVSHGHMSDDDLSKSGHALANRKISLFVRAVVSALDLPYEDAIKFLRDKAGVTSKHWYDVYGAAASRAFWVAGATQQGLVDDFKKAVEKAIAKGTTLQEFRKDFDKIVKKWHWTGWTGEGSKAGRAWRTRIIYDTNLRAAYAAGRFTAMTRPETLEVFPYWQYQHSGSNHPRLDHLSWDGLVLPADDAFWATNYPPNGWHCGCYVTPVGESALRRQGKREPDAAPELLPERRTVGGKPVTGIRGVDSGFEYNVGQEWLARTAPGRETMAAAPGMIESFVEAAMAGSIDPRTHIPAAVSPKRLASAFGLPVKTELRLSGDTIREHLHHSETTPAIYARIVEYAVSEGAFYEDDKGRTSAIVNYEGALWQIGLKKTRNSEIYVTTIHRTEDRKFNQLSRKGRLLWKGKE